MEPRVGRTFPMQTLFLGTGTSYGIPMVGCDCAVCRSDDPRDRRLRTSTLIRHEGTTVLLDTPPDFRQQCLRHGLRALDAVFISHVHADHVFGFDDLRPLTLRRDSPLPVYATAGTAVELRRIFNYLSIPPLPGTSLAKVQLHVVEATVRVGSLLATPLPVQHSRVPMDGWKFQPADPATGAALPSAPSACIITDCKAIPPATMALCRGTDLLVVDALRDRPHPTHMNVEEALAAIAAIAPRQAFLTHLCHELAHAPLLRRLPPNVSVAYDGLAVDLG